ncbi:MAG: hypothetical protein GY944_14270 [bacterium]|nr:hypothetical protein [bacterium]
MGSGRNLIARFGSCDRMVRTIACAVVFAFFSTTLATGALSQTVRRSTGVKDFGESKASTRNQGPKSKSYYERGKSESQKRTEKYEEMWDDLTTPKVHQTGGYCMYGLDGKLIHAPEGRACAETEGGEAPGLSGAKTTTNAIGQRLGKCLKGDCDDGFGYYAWPDGSKYKGNFQQGKMHGHGAILMPSGAKYVGDWKSDMRWGQGTATYSSGKKLAGDWVKNKFVSKQPATGGGDRYARAKKRTSVVPRIRWPNLSKPARRVGGGGRDTAVLVGIENYAHVPEIGKASDNATDWYSYLVKTRGVPVENVALLTDEDATVEEMRAAAEDAAEQVGKGGTLWFVFVGHGAPSKDGKDGLLIGFDAQQKARSLQSRSLARGELLAILEDSRAESINVFLDACFSGKDGGGEQLVAGLQPLIVAAETATTDDRTMLMTAARSNEFAGPLPGGGRPAFSYLALGGLRGWADGDHNGNVTARELHAYVSDAMKALVRDRKQRPTMVGGGQAPLVRSAKEQGPDISQAVMAASGKRRAPSRHPAAPR